MESKIPLLKNYHGGRRMSFESNRPSTDIPLSNIFINNPNSIFVIEDAENIVVDREIKGNSPVSALLNISDGLLSGCLNRVCLKTGN